MENALLIGLSRQMALQRELDVVANNIANINTTGFKTENSKFEEYLMPVARENRFEAPDRLWHNLGSMASRRFLPDPAALPRPHIVALAP